MWIVKDDAKLDTFRHECLRRLLKIYWPICECQIYANEDETISEKVRRRRWTWIGHVLRIDDSSLLRVALTWAPEVFHWWSSEISRPPRCWPFCFHSKHTPWRLSEQLRLQSIFKKWFQNYSSSLSSNMQAHRSLLLLPQSIVSALDATPVTNLRALMQAKFFLFLVIFAKASVLRSSKRFIRGTTLSVFSPKALAKSIIVMAWFYLVCTFRIQVLYC